MFDVGLGLIADGVVGGLDPLAWVACKIKGGHLWCYDSHGPPVALLGGPWHKCVRCGRFGRARGAPLIPYKGPPHA